MSEHHAEEDLSRSSFIKTPKQLVAVIFLAFAIPILLISIIAGLVMRSLEPAAALVKVAAAGSSPVIGVANAASAAKAEGGDAAKSKSVFDSTCSVCHGAGIAGAPKAGDKAAWAPRLKQGIEALYKVALTGKDAMPPKGGNLSLSEADVKAAVDYMVSLVK